MVVVLGAFTAWQAYAVRDALTTVSGQLSESVDRLADDDVRAASTALDEARTAAATARRHTRGPVWWSAAQLPWIGDDVTAVRVVSDVADSLTRDTLPELLEAAEQIGPEELAPRRGRIALAPFRRAAPTLADGARDLAFAEAAVGDLETDGLVDRLAGPVADLQDQLARATSTTEAAATAAELLPPLLGADGPRRYLLVFPNNAEIRAGGGMLGAAAAVEVEDGNPAIVEQVRPGSLGPFGEDFIELSRDELDLFTTRLSVYPQNATFLPDFPRTAEILTRMWQERRPQQLDGMLSVDPVALSYLLRATGPVTLSNGVEVSSGNAVDYLLHGLYQSVPDTALQDLLYEELAREVFDRLLAGGTDPRALLDALTRGVGERRIKLWLTDDGEQGSIAGTAIAAELPTGDGATPEVGVYLNSSAADKLNYFLDYAVDVRPMACAGDGRQVMSVSVRLESTLPEGATLSDSVVGPGLDGVPRGTQRISVYLYAPGGGYISRASMDGEQAPMFEAEHEGRPVGVVTLDLQPGQKHELAYRVGSGRGQVGDPRLITTPGARTDGVGRVGSSACSPR